MADDFLSIMKVLPDPTGAFFQGQQDAANLQGQQLSNQNAQLANQAGQYKLQAAQTADQQAQQQNTAYQTGLADVLQNPTPDRIMGLKLKFPDQAKAISDAFSARDTTTQNADRQQLANIWSLINGGYLDQSKSLLEQRQAADKAAGRSEPMVDALYSALQTDPKHAAGIAGVMLSSIPGGDDFAKTLKTVGDQTSDGTTKGQVVGRAIGHYGDDGKWVLDYRDPEAPKYVHYNPTTGERILEAGGDSGPAFTKPGQTPPVGRVDPIQLLPAIKQQESGGDYTAKNPDTGALGAYQIMPATGASLARRIGVAWNPGLMTADTPAARQYQDQIGQAAVQEAVANTSNAADAARYYHGGSDQSKWGPKTQKYASDVVQRLSGSSDLPPGVRDITPKGGDQPSGGTVGGLTTDAIDAAADLGLQKFNGAPPPGYSRNKQAQAAIANRIAQKIAGYGGIEGAIAHSQLIHSQAKALDSFVGGKNGDVVRTASVALDHLDTMEAASNALANGDYPAFNKVGNFFAQQSGGENPNNFEAVKGIVTQEVAKFIGAGHITDKSILDVQAGIQSSSSPAQLMGYIRKMKSLMGGQLSGLKRQYEATAGAHAPAFSTFLSPAAQALVGGSHPTQAMPQGGGQGQPAVVQGPADIARLPRHTPWVSADGKRRGVTP